MQDIKFWYTNNPRHMESKSLVRRRSDTYATPDAAKDALATVRSVPGFVFGYVDEEEMRIVSFHAES